MDTTENNPQERNEKPRATFDHKDPYSVRLGDSAPADPQPEAETTTEPVSTPEPVVPAEPSINSSVDEASDEEIPPAIPIEMKESLGDYIDEELATNVRALVDKVASLETQLKTERARASVAKETAVKADQFSGVWNSESGKYGDVLASESAKGRVQGAVEVLRAGYKASGIDVPAEAALFEKAVSSEFSASMVEAREKAITEKVEARQNQFVSRGATTAAMNERPEDRAAKAVHRAMQEKGLI